MPSLHPSLVRREPGEQEEKMMWSEFFTPAAAAGGAGRGGGSQVQARARVIDSEFPPGTLPPCRAGLGWAGSRDRVQGPLYQHRYRVWHQPHCHTGSSLARVGQRNQHDHVHVHPMGRISATLARPCQQWQPAGAAFLKQALVAVEAVGEWWRCYQADSPHPQPSPAQRGG